VEGERHPINLKERGVLFNLHSALSSTNGKRWRGRLLEGAVRRGGEALVGVGDSIMSRWVDR
jgi:hypothetical protein